MKTKIFSLIVLLSVCLFYASIALAQEVKVGSEATLKITGSVLEQPNAKAKSLFTINKSDKVKVTEIKGKWSKITSADGKSGWVPNASLVGPTVKETKPTKPAEPPPAARITYLSGDVQVLRGNGEKAPANPGDTLAEKDGVQTGQQSSATVEFTEGRNVVVSENSRVSVAFLRYPPKVTEKKEIESKIKLELGRLFVAIKRALLPKEKFEVESATMVTGVRGTEYRVNLEPGDTSRVEVTESKVSILAAKKNAELKENFGMRVKKGAPPSKPHQLPPPPALESPASQTALSTYYFTWKPVEAAKAYRFEISRDEAFQQLIESSTITTTEVKPQSAVLPIGNYYWRVSTIDKEDFEGKSSAARGFSVSPVQNKQ